MANQFLKFFQTHCVSYTASILLTELCLSTDGKWPICLSELHEKKRALANTSRFFFNWEFFVASFVFKNEKGRDMAQSDFRQCKKYVFQCRLPRCI